MNKCIERMRRLNWGWGGGLDRGEEGGGGGGGAKMGERKQ